MQGFREGRWWRMDRFYEEKRRKEDRGGEYGFGWEG